PSDTPCGHVRQSAEVDGHAQRQQLAGIGMDLYGTLVRLRRFELAWIDLEVDLRLPRTAHTRLRDLQPRHVGADRCIHPFLRGGTQRYLAEGSPRRPAFQLNLRFR